MGFGSKTLGWKCIVFCVAASLAWCGRVLGAEASALTEDEKVILSRFVHHLFEQGEAGYVFHHVKPLSAEGYRVDPLLLALFPRQQEDSLLRLGAKVWSKHVASKGDFRIVVGKSSSVLGDVAINVVRRSHLVATIEENLALFRQVLGPAVTGSDLADRILEGASRFEDILGNDDVLIGIVLGFGVENSQSHTALDRVRSLQWKGFLPPYRPYSTDFVTALLEASRLAPEELAGFPYREEPAFVRLTGQQAVDLLASTQEWDKLSKQIRCTCPQLQEAPAPFICGLCETEAEKGEFEARLKKTQAVIRGQLVQAQFWDALFEGWFDERIRCKTETAHNLSIPSSDREWVVARVIWSRLAEMNPHMRRSFIASMGEKSQKRPRCQWRALDWQSYRNFLRAQADLSEADKYFRTLGGVTTLIPGQLCYEVLNQGAGEPLCGAPTAILDLAVSTTDGDVLHAERAVEIELSATCPGFAHGVQGMKPGECRRIYVHPGVGYGFFNRKLGLRTLVFQVAYHRHVRPGLLPELKAVDLTPIRSGETKTRLYQACLGSVNNYGAKVGLWLSKSRDVRLEKVVDHLKALSESRRAYAVLTEKDLEVFDRIILNIHHST